MSPLRFASAAALALATMPATALAEPGFGAGALTEAELADINGRASPRSTFLLVAAEEQAMSFGQQNSALVRITFDNWFNDVGNAMIWNNVLTGR